MKIIIGLRDQISKFTLPFIIRKGSQLFNKKYWYVHIDWCVYIYPFKDGNILNHVFSQQVAKKQQF